MPAKRHLYRHPRLGLVAVKSGFSWPAFFLGALWAAVKGMWFPAFTLMLAVDAGLWFVTGYAQAHAAGGLALASLAAALVYLFVRGRYGNRWLAASLVGRGYVASGLDPTGQESP